MVLGHEEGIHTAESRRHWHQQRVARLPKRLEGGSRRGAKRMGAVESTAHVPLSESVASAN